MSSQQLSLSLFFFYFFLFFFFVRAWGTAKAPRAIMAPLPWLEVL